MTIKTIYSQQYKKPCVVASPTDAADDVIAACRAGGVFRVISSTSEGLSHAHRYCHECPSGSGVWHCSDEEFVVQLRDDVGPELWTEAALRRSLGKLGKVDLI